MVLYPKDGEKEFLFGTLNNVNKVKNNSQFDERQVIVLPIKVSYNCLDNNFIEVNRNKVQKKTVWGCFCKTKPGMRQTTMGVGRD